MLVVNRVHDASTVTACFATNPVKLLIPRSRGNCVCTYVSSFGGGFVPGDQTRLDVRIGPGARCFIGTQASTKIYRNPGLLPCGNSTNALVGSNGVLVFAPAPVQPFAESCYDQRQQFELGTGAGLALLDWFTSGRSARGERWRFKSFSTRNEVRWAAPGPGLITNGTAPLSGPAFVDACRLDNQDGSLSLPQRSGRWNCFATLLLIGAPFQGAADLMLEETGAIPPGRRASLLVSASRIRQGAVLRLAAEQPADVEDHLRRHWPKVTKVLGDDPWSRKF